MPLPRPPTCRACAAAFAFDLYCGALLLPDEVRGVRRLLRAWHRAGHPDGEDPAVAKQWRDRRAVLHAWDRRRARRERKR